VAAADHGGVRGARNLDVVAIWRFMVYRRKVEVDGLVLGLPGIFPSADHLTRLGRRALLAKLAQIALVFLRDGHERSLGRRGAFASGPAGSAGAEGARDTPGHLGRAAPCPGPVAPLPRDLARRSSGVLRQTPVSSGEQAQRAFTRAAAHGGSASAGPFSSTKARGRPRTRHGAGLGLPFDDEATGMSRAVVVQAGASGRPCFARSAFSSDSLSRNPVSATVPASVPSSRQLI